MLGLHGPGHIDSQHRIPASKRHQFLAKADTTDISVQQAPKLLERIDLGTASYDTVRRPPCADLSRRRRAQPGSKVYRAL